VFITFLNATIAFKFTLDRFPQLEVRPPPRDRFSRTHADVILFKIPSSPSTPTKTPGDIRPASLLSQTPRKRRQYTRRPSSVSRQQCLPTRNLVKRKKTSKKECTLSQGSSLGCVLILAVLASLPLLHFGHEPPNLVRQYQTY
jgi:hypothetical protein